MHVMNREQRLFIALPFDEAAVKSLEGTARFLESHKSSVKSVSPEQYHITIKFIGGVETIRAEELIRQFTALTPNAGAVSCTIKGLGAFPSLSRPSVLWAGLETGGDDLLPLFRQVEDCCSALGFARESRGFRAHLTLARVKRGHTLPERAREYFIKEKEREFCRTKLTKLVLYESTLTPAGPLYQALAVKTL